MDDFISREDTIDKMQEVDWYHQNKNSEMVHGANSSEHQAWYKAEDVYKVLEDMPSAQPEYTELTPEEAASEIASGSIMSASYWIDAMIRLKQMGYAICRKKG